LSKKNWVFLTSSCFPKRETERSIDWRNGRRKTASPNFGEASIGTRGKGGSCNDHKTKGIYDLCTPEPEDLLTLGRKEKNRRGGKGAPRRRASKRKNEYAARHLHGHGCRGNAEFRPPEGNSITSTQRKEEKKGGERGGGERRIWIETQLEERGVGGYEGRDRGEGEKKRTSIGRSGGKGGGGTEKGSEAARKIEIQYHVGNNFSGNHYSWDIIGSTLGETHIVAYLKCQNNYASNKKRENSQKKNLKKKKKITLRGLRLGPMKLPDLCQRPPTRFSLR